MLDNIKQFISLKTIDQLIYAKNYEQALDKLNALIKDGFRPSETYLKRGELCQTLLMYEDAYSDYTYVIMHCQNNYKGYQKRMFLNFEISNFIQAVDDAYKVLEYTPDDFEPKRILFLSLVFSEQKDDAKNYICNIFQDNKYKIIQFLLNETAIAVTKDEIAKALKILEVIDLIDKDNPMKLLKEANIYSNIGDNERQDEILKKIESIFPKYFISHFKFGDIYESRDLLEICFLLELQVFDTQNLFAYPMAILQGYRDNLEGRITDSKESFERAIQINPDKPEAYVLLGETYQLMSGYDNVAYRMEAEKNYKKALEIFERENLITKADNMRRQIKHLNSKIVFGK